MNLKWALPKSEEGHEGYISQYVTFSYDVVTCNGGEINVVDVLTKQGVKDPARELTDMSLGYYEAWHYDAKGNITPSEAQGRVTTH